MTILQAIRDPNLFGGWFESPSWRRWFVALAAIFALPIDDLRACGLTPDEALSLFAQHTGRSSWPSVPMREFWGLIGRRGGKSRVMALVGVFLACFRRYTLAPGERGVVMLLSADKKQAKQVRRYLGAFINETPMLAAMVVRETTESIELDNHVTVEVHVASYRTTRGYTCVGVICDEICFWRNADDSANPDSEVLTALRPAMATIPGALLMVISSPFAKRGEAYRTDKRHWGKDGDVLVWKGATREMNPEVPEEFVQREYEKDPESAKPEYGAEWRDDITTFLDREQIEALVIDTEVHPCQPGVRYFAHCDPSGGRGDSMTLAIGHSEQERVVLDFLAERQPPFDPEDAVAEFAASLGIYRVRDVQIDSYAAEWVPSAFRRMGVTAHLPMKPGTREPSGVTTSDHYRGLLPLVTTGSLRLLNHKRLINQLANLERRVSPGGRELISHPPNSHDDCAAALAGMAAQAARAPVAAALFAHIPWLDY